MEEEYSSPGNERRGISKKKKKARAAARDSGNGAMRRGAVFPQITSANTLSGSLSLSLSSLSRGFAKTQSTRRSRLCQNRIPEGRLDRLKRRRAWFSRNSRFVKDLARHPVPAGPSRPLWPRAGRSRRSRRSVATPKTGRRFGRIGAIRRRASPAERAKPRASDWPCRASPALRQTKLSIEREKKRFFFFLTKREREREREPRSPARARARSSEDPSFPTQDCARVTLCLSHIPLADSLFHISTITVSARRRECEPSPRRSS